MTRDDLEQVVEELVDRVDELEDENEELRGNLEKLRSNSVTYTTLNHLAAALTDAEVDNYAADPMNQRGDMAAFGDRVRELAEQVEENAEFIDEWGEGETTDRDEAWFQTVQAARNLHGNPNHTTDDGNVVLYADNLDQTLSYSYRYCLDLIETWGDEKPGATWKSYQPATAGENNEERRKRLVLDMDEWGEGE